MAFNVNQSNEFRSLSVGKAGFHLAEAAPLWTPGLPPLFREVETLFCAKPTDGKCLILHGPAPRGS